MKKKYLFIYILVASIFLFSGCRKDYVIGGSTEDTSQYKKMTTYEALKTMPLYDTLVKLIDAAGMADKINASNTTLFAPNNYSIRSYLNLRTLYVQNTINVSKIFGLDSLIYYLTNNIKGTKDSLAMYLIGASLNYDVLTNTGAYYTSGLPGSQIIVSYEYTRDANLGYNPLVSTVPRVVYYTFLWKPYTLTDSNPVSDVPTTVGVRTLVKMSGLETKNGIINGLESSHILFFYNTKK